MNAFERLQKMIEEAPDVSPDAPQDNLPKQGDKVFHRYKKRTHGVVSSVSTHEIRVTDNFEQEHYESIDSFQSNWVL